MNRAALTGASAATAVIVNHADIAVTAVAPAGFPTDNRPEAAFVGRSNVGKSSLINAMLGRKKLARTSRQPGKTRTINFYDVAQIKLPAQGTAPPAEPPPLYFVDLPGYGYAKVSKEEQAKWAPMVEGYLKNRPQLVHIFLLMDIRHEPSAGDRMIYDWVRHYNLPHTIVATKADKLSRNRAAQRAASMRRELQLTAAPIPFSAETRAGREELWQIILAGGDGR